MTLLVLMSEYSSYLADDFDRVWSAFDSTKKITEPDCHLISGVEIANGSLYLKALIILKL